MVGICHGGNMPVGHDDDDNDDDDYYQVGGMMQRQSFLACPT